jgi:hypothetical protein
MPLKQNVRAIGKPGGSPKRRLSLAKKWSLREFADMILNDSVVQHRILKQARAGTLPARVLAELFHYYGGRPPSKPELPPPDPTRAAAYADLCARIARLSRAEQQQLYELDKRMMEDPAPAGPGVPAKPGHEAR